MSETGVKVCRLCLAEVDVACPIFSKTSSENVDLPQRIMSCALIKVIEGDGLPASICSECLLQVDKSYQFKLQCERSDAQLRKSVVQDNCSSLTISITSVKTKTNTEDRDVSPSATSNNSTVNDTLCNGNGAHQQNNSEFNGRNDEEVEDQEEDDDEEDSDVDEGNSNEESISGIPPPGVNDSESVDGWEVMKFTPEVIINEEDSKGSGDGAENGLLIPRNMNSLAEQQLYQLSQVEAILRNHGTEIKVQAGGGGGSAYQHRKHSASTPMSNEQRMQIAAGHENHNSNDVNGSSDDYLSMYGVEAVLNASSDDSGASSAKSRRTQNGEKLFKCRLCPKSYSFSSALSRHKAVHNTMLRPYVCPVCKKGFAEPEKLERHSRTHLVDRTWRCNNCGRIFKALNTYERHVTTICSYRNKENGGGIVSLPPGLTAHAVNVIPQTVMYRNS